MNFSCLMYAAGAIILWSTNAVVAKYALMGLFVEQIQLLQFISAALAFAIIKWSKREKKTRNQSLPLKALVLGVIGLTGTMIFQYLAFAYAPITQSNIIAYSWPLIATIWIVPGYSKSGETPSTIIFALLGFVGVLLVVSGGEGFTYHKEHTIGYMFAFISALCMAVYTVGIAKSETPSASLLIPSTICGIVITFLWYTSKSQPWPDLEYILLGIYLGAGPIGCGYYCWSQAARKDTTGRIPIFAYLTPVCSTGLLFVSGEALSLGALLGAGIVFSSCFLLGIKRDLATNA